MFKDVWHPSVDGFLDSLGEGTQCAPLLVFPPHVGLGFKNSNQFLTIYLHSSTSYYCRRVTVTVIFRTVSAGTIDTKEHLEEQN
jgi:hypothetical protein